MKKIMFILIAVLVVFFASNAFAAVPYNVSVAQNASNNQFLVAWLEIGNDADVYAQITSAEGSFIGSPTAISLADKSQQFPSVAYNDATNQFLVTWSNIEADNSRYIYGALVNSSGAMIGSSFLIYAGDFFEYFPVATYNDSVEKYVVFVTGGGALRSVIVNGDGSLSSSETILATGLASNAVTSIVFNSQNKQYLATFNVRSSVQGVLINANGSSAGSLFTIYQSTSGSLQNHVAYDDSTNQFLVTYIDTVPNRSYRAVFGQLVSDSGNLQGNSFNISGDGGVRLISTFDKHNKKFFVAWTSNSFFFSSKYNANTRGRFVETDGSLPTPVEFIVDRFVNQVVFNSADNTVVAFASGTPTSPTAEGSISISSIKFIEPCVDSDRDGFGNAGTTLTNCSASTTIPDNCPDVSNALQTDTDADGLGDACDGDQDGDSVLNEVDNCPLTFNTDQTNFDADLQGDACDQDSDNDGIANTVDQCLFSPLGQLVGNDGCELASIDVLLSHIDGYGIDNKTGSSLVKKLENADADYLAGRKNAGNNVMNAFVNQVGAQAGISLTEEQANELTTIAAAVLIKHDGELRVTPTGKVTEGLFSTTGLSVLAVVLLAVIAIGIWIFSSRL
jgi:hypothetical protein